MYVCPSAGQHNADHQHGSSLTPNPLVAFQGPLSRNPENRGILAIVEKGLAKRGYTARREADGTFTILDVPIMVEHTPPEDKTKYLGRDWMTECIKFDKALQAVNDHKGRVHIRHNGEISPASGKGFLELTDVKKIKLAEQKQLDPKDPSKVEINIVEKDALYSNLRGFSEMDVQAMAEKRWPYRSVEFARSLAPQIMGLALLETEPPFFKLPILTVDKIENDGKFVKHEAMQPALATYSSQAHHAVLFRIDEAEEKKPEGEKPDGKDEQPKGGKPEPKSDGEGGESMVLRLLKNMCRAMGLSEQGDSQVQVPPDSPGEGPVTDKGGKKPEEKKEAVKMSDEATIKRLAEAEAKADLANASVKKMEAQRHRDDVIARVKKDLASYVLPEGRLEEKFDKDGESAMLAYAQAIKEYGTPVPNASSPEQDAIALMGDDKAGAEEMKKFVSQGPEIAARAAQYAREYRPENWLDRPHMTRARFVEIRLAANGKQKK